MFYFNVDMLDSIVLPRFHLDANDEAHWSPKRTRTCAPDYTCAWLGNENGDISFGEYQLILRLLQVPTEHFEVAFYMFDLDQNGTWTPSYVYNCRPR